MIERPSLRQATLINLFRLWRSRIRFKKIAVTNIFITIYHLRMLKKINFIFSLLVLSHSSYANFQINFGELKMTAGDTQVKCDRPLSFNIDTSISNNIEKCTNDLKILPIEGQDFSPLSVIYNPINLNADAKLKSIILNENQVDLDLEEINIPFEHYQYDLPALNLKCFKEKENFLSLPIRNIIQNCFQSAKISIAPWNLNGKTILKSSELKMNIVKSVLSGSLDSLILSTGTRNTKLLGIRLNFKVDSQAMPPKADPKNKLITNLHFHIDQFFELDKNEHRTKKRLIDLDRLSNMSGDVVDEYVYITAKYNAIVIPVKLNFKLKYKIDFSKKTLTLVVDKGVINLGIIKIGATDFMVDLIRNILADDNIKVEENIITIQI